MRQSFKSKGQRGTAESDAVGERRKFFNWRFVAKEERRVNRLAFILFWSILMYFFFKTYVVSVGIVTDISMGRTLPEGFRPSLKPPSESSRCRTTRPPRSWPRRPSRRLPRPYPNASPCPK